jgi:hypothetical protein
MMYGQSIRTTSPALQTQRATAACGRGQSLIVDEAMKAGIVVAVCSALILGFGFLAMLTIPSIG